MNYKGKIKKLNHIVISDPTYETGVWCRYEENNLDEKNWLVDLEINELEDKIDGCEGIEFCLLLKKNINSCVIDGDRLSYSRNTSIKDYKIAADTACIAYGINKKADEIIKSKEEWQPNCALKTLSDGVNGNVIEGKKDNKLSFIYIYGYFDRDTGYKEKDILKYLEKNFEIADMTIIKEIVIDKNRELNPGEKVEISFCHITNDVGGTTKIKHKDYVDEIDGMNLTIHQPDGTIEKTVINTDYPCIEIPIRVEVISSTYDYETGFKYKAKVLDDEVISKFKKIGTTGYTEENYKKYNNTTLYEDTKTARENFNPSIVYFSEFDVVKRLEKESSLEVEK